MPSPAGCLSLPQAALETILADCTAFRALTDPAMDQAGALARIYQEGLPKPASGRIHTLAEFTAYRPYAIIWTDPERGFIATGEASSSDGTDFIDAGRLILEIERTATDPAYDEPSSADNLLWRNAVGQIIDDLKRLAGQGGYLCITSIEVEEGTYWNHPSLANTHGVYQGVKLAITWEGAG